MKKIQKTKSWLTLTAGVLGATSVVAPLSIVTTSCSNNNQINPIEFAADKEYGVTEATYNDLKESFEAEYKSKLELEHHDEDYVQKRVNYLDKQLSSLDKIKEEKKHGFTTLTSSMMEFSKEGTDFDGYEYKDFNLRLNRKSNAQWSQLDTIFNNWKGSFRQYMLNSDLPASTINRVMQDAQNKFVDLKEKLIETSSDVLDGVIKGKQLLITCFSDVNDEIALVSATMQLKELMNQYAFETNTDAAACLDNITNKDSGYYLDDFKVGNILSNETMQKLFTLTRKDDGKEIPFTNTLVKGYTIQPKLTMISTNKYMNVHTFKIDFGLVKTSYLGKYNKEQLAAVTAHQYSADNWGDLDKADDNISLTQLIQKCEIQSTEYPIYLTKEGEFANLQEIYFNKESSEGFISFQWDNKNADNQAYEAFFDNATMDSDGKWTSQLSNNSLINSCLMISDNASSYKFIKDALASRPTITENNLKEARLNNLVDKFLETCEISANVEIDETNPNNKVVSVTDFLVNYENSIYKNKEDGKLKLENTSDYTKFQDKCVNHEVSKSFFEKVNNNYNSIVRFVTVFDESIVNSNNKKNEPITEAGLDELREDTDKEFFYSTASITLGTIASTATLITACDPWNPDTRNKAISGVSALLLTASLTAQLTMYSLWAKKYYSPVENFLYEHEDFKDKSENSNLVQDLTSDLNHYVLFNEDGSYDQKEFDAKKKEFTSLGMAEMLRQYRDFSSIETNASRLNDDWGNYDALLNEYNLDPDELMEKISGWKAGGKYWMIQSGISIGTTFMGIVLAFWQKKNEAAKRAQIAYDQKVHNKIEELSPQIQEEFERLAHRQQVRDYWFSTSPFSPVAPLFATATLVWDMSLAKFSEQIWGSEKSKYDNTPHAQSLRENMNQIMGSDSDAPWDIGLLTKIICYGE